MKPIRFAVVSADVLIRELLSRMLPLIEARLVCVAVLVCDGDALAACRAKTVDLVVFAFAGRDPAEQLRLRELAAEAWPLLVVVREDAVDPRLGELLLRRGCGLLSRQSTPDELAHAAVLAGLGGTYVDAALGGILAARVDPPAETHLSQRERHVLQLVAEGHSTKEVANILRLSIKTVDKYRTSVMQKLDVHDVVKLTHYAIRRGYVTVAS